MPSSGFQPHACTCSTSIATTIEKPHVPDGGVDGPLGNLVDDVGVIFLVPPQQGTSRSSLPTGTAAVASCSRPGFVVRSAIALDLALAR